MLDDRLGVPARLVGTLALGTLLNPLNSSMIAVALISLQRDFEVGVATSSWLVSGFYLAAAVGQPLMGRFVDLFGARQLFVAGLVIGFGVSVLAPFAPGFWWLVALRVLQAVGTSTAFPSALVLIRNAAGARADRGAGATGPPAGALAALTIAASTSAALGPVLGGFLVAFAGWQAVFLVNLPITATGIVLALRVLPRSSAVPHAGGRSYGLLRTIDLPGIVLFSGALAGLLVFLLASADSPPWWLVPVVVALSVLLVLRERAARSPFLDVRGLVANPALASVLAQQGGVNLVFYCVFFGMPMWLETVRGFSADQVGLLVLPIALMGVIMTPVAARTVRRHGSRATLVLGSAVLLVGTLLIQVLGDSTHVVMLVAVALLLGIPNGLNNLGLQTALYETSAGPGRILRRAVPDVPLPRRDPVHERPRDRVRAGPQHPRAPPGRNRHDGDRGRHPRARTDAPTPRRSCLRLRSAGTGQIVPKRAPARRSRRARKPATRNRAELTRQRTVPLRKVTWRRGLFDEVDGA